MILGSPIVQDPNKTLILKVETDIPEMKITLKNTWLHFKKVCTHKFWVAYYCFKVGLYWQGLMHDMSKFSWVEFWESVKYYQGTKSPIDACKENKGYSLAWQHHKGHNPHHYEYWTDRYDDGTVALEMPYKYAVELLCDWLGAGRAYFGENFSYEKEWEWWRNKIENKHPKMNQQTANFVDIVFCKLKEREKCGSTEPFDDMDYDTNLKYYFKLAYMFDKAAYDKFCAEIIKEDQKRFERLKKEKGIEVTKFYSF